MNSPGRHVVMIFETATLPPGINHRTDLPLDARRTASPIALAFSRQRGQYARMTGAGFDRSVGTSVASGLERADRIADTVRNGAGESERLGHLSPAVFDALQSSDLFRILIPQGLGGFGLTIPESIQVFERVATFDASTAWTLAILAGGPLLARRLSDDAFTHVCREPVGLIAGSLNPASARAEQTDGGYLFSGKATYLSGSAHAQWIIASAIVTEGQRPLLRDGRVEVRSGLFPIEQARSLDTWHVTGMCATGSTDYAFEDVKGPLQLDVRTSAHACRSG